MLEKLPQITRGIRQVGTRHWGGWMSQGGHRLVTLGACGEGRGPPGARPTVLATRYKHEKDAFPPTKSPQGPTRQAPNHQLVYTSSIEP